MSEVTSSQKTTALVLAGALGIAGLFWAYSKNDSKTGASACTLTASAVGILAARVSRGATAETITLAAPFLGGVACTQLVDAWFEKPTTPMNVQVQTPQGGTTRLKISLEDLRIPPVPPQSTCMNWQSQVLRDMCFEGTLFPPSAS